MAKSARKGQITVFIVIAIVLLFSTALVLYIRNQVKEYEPQIEEIAEVPLELQPVKNYVETCMKEVAEDGLVLVGRQGAQMYLDNFDLITPTIDPNNADVLMLGENSFLPYWFYQSRNGIDQLRIPESHISYDGDGSVEDQFNTYMNDNLLECINDFQDFEEQSIEVQPQGQVSARTTVNEDDVTIIITYPLKVTVGEQVSDMSNFITKIPVRLGKILRLAKEITEAEYEQVFIEGITNNLISIYSGIDRNKLPPPAGGLDFTTCDKRVFWLYFDVLEDMKQMLTGNIPYIKIRNTEYNPITVTDLDEPDEEARRTRQSVFNNMIVNVGSETYHNIRADFVYNPSYSLDLDLGSMGLIEPTSMDINLIMAQYCMFDYRIFYDLKFPVIIRLTDSRSYLDTNPYVLQFPIQVVIKDNFPRVRYAQPDPLFLDDTPNYECMPAARDSGDINITVLDANTENALEDAVVFFQCGPGNVYTYDAEGNVNGVTEFAQRCLIGSTDEAGELITPLPSCIGGSVLFLRKNSYLETFDVVGDILPGVEDKFEYELQPLVTKKLKVMKFFVEPPIEGDVDPGVVVNSNGDVVECNIKSDARTTTEYEDVLIRIEKIDPENGIYNGVPVIFYTSEQEEQTIDLSAGTYYFDVQLIRKERYLDEMTIRKNSQCKTVPKNAWGGTETICYPDEDILLPQIFTGGSRFVWDIGNDIYDDNEVTIFVMDEGPPERLEQIGAPTNHVDRCSELNEASFRPRLN